MNILQSKKEDVNAWDSTLKSENFINFLKFQQNVKCRPTYREALTKKKSFRDKEVFFFSKKLTGYSKFRLNYFRFKFSISNQSTVSNSLNQNLHHWICRKYDENKFENKCRACLKVNNV